MEAIKAFVELIVLPIVGGAVAFFVAGFIMGLGILTAFNIL